MHRLPQIQILDEQLITEEERFRAEIYYTESSVRTWMTLSRSRKRSLRYFLAIFGNNRRFE